MKLNFRPNQSIFIEEMPDSKGFHLFGLFLLFYYRKNETQDIFSL